MRIPFGREAREREFNSRGESTVTAQTIAPPNSTPFSFEKGATFLTTRPADSASINLWERGMWA